MSAKRPINNGEYSYGFPANRNVSVVQKLVKVKEVQKTMRQAWTRSGCWKKMVRMEKSILW